ncbi:MAG: M28 family peptidase, partial [Bdellovibrionales bacterium]|nr:M28 family peptidase [Bdellovibrionales bacterium]
TENGVFVGNFIGSLSRREPSLLFSAMRTFQSVFPNSYFFAADSPAALRSQNILFVGLPDDAAFRLDQETLDSLGGAFFPTLRAHLVAPGRYSLQRHLQLTDDYAPVDYLTSRLLREVSLPAATPRELADIFSGGEALALVRRQLEFGPRYLSAPQRAQFLEWLVLELESLGIEVHRQEFPLAGADQPDVRVTNVVARLFPEKAKRIIIATHWDTRRYSEQTPDQRETPVPGANDGGSGTAVLLELARALTLVVEKPEIGVDLVFFDGEEGLEGQDIKEWRPIGSPYFAEHLRTFYPERLPEAGIVIDMVCDDSLELLQEETSRQVAGALVEHLWKTGAAHYPQSFLMREGPKVGDDHDELIAAGVPSALIIDYAYPQWHTPYDTFEQCSS